MVSDVAAPPRIGDTTLDGFTTQQLVMLPSIPQMIFPYPFTLATPR